MKKRGLIIITILFSTCCIYAQTFTITGKIINEQNTPIEFANVVLLQRVDSMFVAGTATDSLGAFSIAAKQNDYLLKISFMGYQTKFIDVNSANLGMIAIFPDENNLTEVTVTASRPIIKMENGGISTDIQNSYLKNIGAATDVLGQLPFVNNNKGDITVFGKGAPLIYINNRLVRDNSELEQLNSNQIKKVTVITNPSAEYDATVQSVIRIETIKQVGDGFSGDVRTGTTKDKRFSHYEGVNINFRYENFDVFGGFSFGKQNNAVVAKLNQITNSNDVATVSQNYRSEATNKNYSARIGINYIFNKNHSAGIMFRSRVFFVSDYLGNYDFNAIKNNILTESFKSTSNAKNKPCSNNLNAYYAGKFAEWFSAKLYMDYATGSDFSGQYTQNFREDSTEIIHTENKNNYDLYAAKLILTSPLWHGELNYGYEFAKTINNQIFNVLIYFLIINYTNIFQYIVRD